MRKSTFPRESPQEALYLPLQAFYANISRSPHPLLHKPDGARRSVLAVNIRVPALETFIAEACIVFHAHEGSFFFRTTSTSSHRGEVFFESLDSGSERASHFSIRRTRQCLPGRSSTGRQRFGSFFSVNRSGSRMLINPCRNKALLPGFLLPAARS